MFKEVYVKEFKQPAHEYNLDSRSVQAKCRHSLNPKYQVSLKQHAILRLLKNSHLRGNSIRSEPEKNSEKIKKAEQYQALFRGGNELKF